MDGDFYPVVLDQSYLELDRSSEVLLKCKDGIALSDLNNGNAPPPYEATTVGSTNGHHKNGNGPTHTDDNPSRDSSTPTGCCTKGPIHYVDRVVDKVEEGVMGCYKDHTKSAKMALNIILLLAFTAYVIIACVIDFDRSRDLFYIAVVFYFCLAYHLVKVYAGEAIYRSCLEPLHGKILKKWGVIKWILIGAFVVFCLFWIIYDSAKEAERLISLVGLFIYLLIGYLTSKNRRKIKWRPVLWGFALQFVFGLLILRTTIGFQVFKWIGDLVTRFLNFASAGSNFLFWNAANGNPTSFAFAVLPVVVYFSAFTYTVYYLGWIQVVIKKIAWLLTVTMGTSPAESVSAAGNIFVGQTEAPLLIRPFLEGMTSSELHAVMTGGFATIAGTVLGAYISFGASATHLLSASVMSAPAALAMSKLMYPETETPECASVEDLEIEKGEEKNMFEALSVGASMSITLVANIAVMLIAFLSMLACVNAILGWIGTNVGYEGLSFERICSYVLMPFAYIMGVAWEDSFTVASLLGTKTFLNEFIAYKELGVYIKNRREGLAGIKLSPRSEVIATYALCGFANFGSLGVQIGGISAIAPGKRPQLAKCAVRALLAGTMACFMTACIAGVLYELDEEMVATSTPFLNVTSTLRP